MERFDEILEKTKEIFTKSRGSHDWGHVERVYNLCIHIGKKENADLHVLKYAAVLHDIGRHDEDLANGKICHAKIGAEKAREMLLDSKIEMIDEICHCIQTHRFRGDKKPLSKEAKVLFDADKLDSIGAVGIGRAFLFAGEIGAKLHEKEIDIEKIKPYSKDDTAYREFLYKLKNVKERMLTSQGKKIAEGRHKFMEDFFKRINDEVDGKL
ncbi:MAG: HD domain-containing protein [Nanoarchaeota archaeon]